MPGPASGLTETAGSLAVVGKNLLGAMSKRITSKGQVTIPQAVREATGLLPNTDVDFVVDAGEVRIVKAIAGSRASRGSTVVRHLRDLGARVRMTTDEIMALTREG